MRTALSSSRPGGVSTRHSPQRKRPLWEEATLPRGSTPLEEAPPQEEAPTLRQRHPPLNRITDRCKNITLLQTSFAGGKNLT